MNWAPFISRLANILTNKVYFLNKYSEFSMNYALLDGAELDVEDQVNVPARLSTLLANLNIALRWALSNMDPVINGAIKPMIEEAHSLYLSLTVVMADLLGQNDEPDIVQSTLSRYEEERLILREIIMRAKNKQVLNLFEDVGISMIFIHIPSLSSPYPLFFLSSFRSLLFFPAYSLVDSRNA